MVRHIWILFIKILVLEFDVFKANAISSAFLPPPSDVSLISIDISTLRLLWTPPDTTNETLTGFNITWDGNRAFVDNSSTAFNITNLQTPGRNYTANISACYAEERNSEFVSVSNNTFPFAPYNLAVVNRGTHSLNISFEQQGDWDSCFAWVDNVNGPFGCSKSSKMATVTGLPVAGREYTIHIVATSGSLNSSANTAVERTIPSAPYNLTVVDRGTNSLNISFEQQGDWESCFAWVDNVNGPFGCSKNSKMVTVSGLPVAGREYTIHIVATSGSLNSSANTTVERTIPSAPYNLTVVDRGTNSLNISFEQQGDWESCFAWVDNVNGPFGCSKNSKMVTVSGLPVAGREYTIHIVATSGSLNSSANTTVERTIPSAPYNLTVVDRGTNSLNISFEQQGDWESCFAWVDNATGSFGCSKSSKMATVSGLPVAGREYVIHIFATSGSLNSSANTTMERTIPFAPYNLAVVDRGTNSLNISFEQQGDWDSCFAWVDNATGSFGCSKSSKMAIISGLPVAGREYTIHIVATSGSLNSSANTTMGRTIPSAPYNLTVVDRGTNSLNISFEQQGDWESCFAWVDNVNGPFGCSKSSKMATVSGLPVAGREYTIHIVATSGSLNSSANTTMERTIPSAPYNLTVVDRGTNSLNISFEQQGDWESCFAWVDNVNGPFGCSKSSKMATVSGLPVAGREYTIHIVATSGSLNSSANTTMKRTSPPRPGPLLCSSITTTSLAIWIGSPTVFFELDGYLVSISSTIPLFNYSKSTIENATMTQPNVTLNAIGLMAGVTYSISAKTKIENLFSEVESQEKCTTDLNAPKNVRANNTSEKAVEVTWDKPEGNFDGFSISCDGQNQAIDVISATYRNPGADTTFNTFCNGTTAGALYKVNVSTFLNQTTTPMKPSDTVQTVTVPMPPLQVSASPIDTKSIQMTLLYGYSVNLSQCTFYEIRYSNRTEYVAYAPTLVNQTLRSLESDSRYDINTFAQSNYSTTFPSISRNSTPTSAWTLAPPVTNITGNESLPRSLEVIIEHQPFPKNVWQYVIQVTNSTHSVQGVQITCSGVNSTTLTEINCVWNNTLLQSNATCSNGSFAYNIMNLRPYTNYSVSVQAVNPGGCSLAKSIVLLTNESTPLCLDIVNARANITMIDVVWSAPLEPNGPITGYEITYFPEGHDPNVTMANVTHTNETSITLVDLDAYVNYTIKVAAVNGAGVGTYEGCSRSTITAQTRIGRPFAPTLMVTPLSPYSVLITWTLSVEKRTGPETYYNLTITDTRNATLMIYEYVAGFYNRSVVVGGLDAYWMYCVDIVAYVFDENGEELPTAGANVSCNRTLESPPGQVRSFAVSSLSSEGRCNESKVTWEEPPERDLNGIITNYVIQWQQVNGNDQGSKTEPNDLRLAIIRVNPDEQQYSFTIQAINSAGVGNATTIPLQSTGSCLPVPVQDVSGVLMKDDSGDDLSTTNSFPVDFDLQFFQQNDNGKILHSGLFVREVGDNENINNMTVTGNESLYSNALTWSDAIKMEPIPEYRATGEIWLPDSTNVTRRKRSSLSRYIIGGDATCSENKKLACNGPLRPNRKYRVRPIICTRGGCYMTEYSIYIYRTKPTESMAWIAAVVILPIACIIAVVLIILYIRRQPKKGGKRKSNDSEIHSIQGGNRQRFRIATKPVPIDSFQHHIGVMHRDSDLLFSDEYREIQELSPKYPWSVAEEESVKAKNRFINILPFDKTRVRLHNSRNGSDYINANYVMSGVDSREYIASQGPLPTTLDDFWLMVWQEQSTVIVMLTNLKENGRVKCEQYWPRTLNETVQYGIVSVTMTHEQDYTSYNIRRFTAQVNGQKARQLTQFHFVAWPDFGVPAHPQLLTDFIKVVRQCIGHQIEPPSIVHCSAGVGRTGTFIALDRLLRRVNEAISIDVFGTVLQLREYRCQMVQTEAQYIFIHDCMSLEIDRLRNPESTYEGVYNEAYDDIPEPMYANGDQVKQALNDRNGLA